MRPNDFVHLYRTDPAVAMVARMQADAWVLGYEAARKEAQRAQSVDSMFGIGPSELLAKAYRDLYHEDQRALANVTLAIAALTQK